MNTLNLRRRTWIITCALAIFAITSPALAAPPARAVPPNAHILGMSYGDWSVAWWQWVYSIPFDDNPLTDLTGEQCDLGQSLFGEPTPVFFLATVHQNALPEAPTFYQVERTCTVPAGSYIFVPLIADACNNTPDEPDLIPPSEAKMRACISSVGNNFAVDSLHLTVNGRRVWQAFDLARFRTQSPAFGFTLPEESLLWISGHYNAVSDGYFVMLRPLPPGAHTVHFGGSWIIGDELAFGQDIRYQLIVEE